MKAIFTFLVVICLISICDKTNAQTPGWQWANAMGGTGNDVGKSIAVDPAGSGDVYTTGQFEGTADFDPGVGITNITSAGASDVFITKMDAFGNLIWAKAIGGTNPEAGTSIAVGHSGSGDVYATGLFKGTVDFDPGVGTFNVTAVGSGFELFVVKLDASGNLVWAKNMGGEASLGCAGNFIVVDPSGSIYTTGEFYGTVDFDPGAGIANLTAASANFPDVFISKLDNSGNFLWAKAMGGSNHDVGYSLAVDPSGSGDVYTTGSFRGTVDFDPGTGTFDLTAAGNQSIFISKLDGAGNFLWAKTMGGLNNIYGRSIAIDPVGIGSVYTTGIFNGTVDFDPSADAFNLTANDYDIFISKLDGDGNFVWAKAMGGPGFDVGLSIVVDPTASGEVYTTGNFKGTGDFNPGIDTFNLNSAGLTEIFLSKLDSAGNFLWAKAIGGAKDESFSSIAIDALGRVNVTGGFFSPTISLDSATLLNASAPGLTYDIFIAKLDIILSGTKSREDNIGITLYPNPATGTVQFDFGYNPIEPFYLTLTDAAGRVVLSKKMHEKELNVSHLSPGLYFMKIQNGERTGVTKLLKQ